MKKNIIARVDTTKKRCTSAGKKCVSGYVRRLLNRMDKNNETTSQLITQAVYARLEELYGGPRNTSVPGESRNISWLVHTTLNFLSSGASIHYSVEGSGKFEQDVVVVGKWTVHWFNDLPSFTRATSRNLSLVGSKFTERSTFSEKIKDDLLKILNSKPLANGALPVETIHQYLPFDNKQCQNSGGCVFAPGVTCCQRYIPNRMSIIFKNISPENFNIGKPTMPFASEFYSLPGWTLLIIIVF